MSVTFDTAIQFVKGVGPRRAEMFSKAGIQTAEDLLKYVPFRYEDRTNFKQIRDLKQDQEVVIQARVAATGRYTTARKKIKIFEMVVEDDTATLQVKFFNQPYLEQVFHKGQKVILFGVPKIDVYASGISMVSPEVEIIGSESDRRIHTGRITPVYRKIGQITTRTLRQIIFQMLADLSDQVEDPLPDSVVTRYKFPDRRSAFKEIHFPGLQPGKSRAFSLRELECRRTVSYQRFIFEEFFLFQLGLQITKQRRQSQPKERVICIDKEIRNIIKSILPFHPTVAQKRVLKEIVDDLCSSRVMNRLLQGDVGSGKTIVALQAMIVVVENGYQTVLMAPTEILAEQHFKNLEKYLVDTHYKLALLTSRVKGKDRRSILSQIDKGQVQMLVGTHALIQKGVDFENLGLIVIDEQHRFGVSQRSQLMKKGNRPETLVMTATPIPRSLAMTLYGDLDLSVLDELPPGRHPTKTVVKTEKSRREVYRTLRRELEKGRQAFIVYPLIEESEKLDLRAAKEMAKHLQKYIFEEYKVGLMHGRLKSDEKESLMLRFKEGEIHILVSTTVIEVGIDVPNATLVLIEHAERFGLSQLHQLRGRIGRGHHPGLCILLTEGVHSPEAYKRLRTMSQTSDGFKIAEKDLEIRGPGEFVGTRQSGVPEFLFGNIVRDYRSLELARREAEGYLSHCLDSARKPSVEVLSNLAKWWKEKYGFYDVG